LLTKLLYSNSVIMWENTLTVVFDFHLLALAFT